MIGKINRSYNLFIFQFNSQIMKNTTTKTIATQLKENEVLAKVLFNRAIKRSALKDYNGAINDLTQAIEFKPDYAEAFFQRGKEFGNTTNHHQQAKDDYKRAVFFNLKTSEAYYNLSLFLEEDESIMYLDQAILLNPDSYDAHFSLGLKQLYNDNLDEAIATFEKAIQINPGLSSSYEMIAQIKRKQNDFEASEAIMKTCEEMCENSIDELFDKAETDTSSSEEEIDYFNRIIKIDPNNIKAYELRADAKYFSNDYEGAIADYSRLIDMDPRNAKFYTLRANAKIKVNDYKGALKDFNSVSLIDLEFLHLYFEKRFQNFKPQTYIKILTSLMTCSSITKEEAICKLIKPTLIERF